MSLFNKRSQSADESSASPSTVQEHGHGKGKKGRPTPKRKQAEAQRMRPVVPADRQAARKAARAKRDEAFERQNRAMITGDERYFPPRDKGPLRRYVRDYVDARYCLGELFLPVSLSMFVLMIFLNRLPQVQFGMLITLYVLFIAAIIDSVICYVMLKRKLVAKFGQERVSAESRLFFYVFSRYFNVRRWRRPVPQVKRREYPH